MRHRMRLVILGDSVTAGFGLDPAARHQAYPALLAGRLRQAGLPLKVIPSALDGIDTAYALRRFDRLVTAHRPDWVAVVLGLNDARPASGSPPVAPASFADNCRGLVERIRAQSAWPILVAPNPRLEPPPAMGGRAIDLMRPYVQALRRVARHCAVSWIDLHGKMLAHDPSELLADGVHPCAAGHRRIAELLAEAMVAVWNAYCAAEWLPRGEPLIGWAAGKGRPATAKPRSYSSFFNARYSAKLSG